MNGFQKSALIMYGYVYVGYSELVDFENCRIEETCCHNMGRLNDLSHSIHVGSSCVKLFTEKECQGESQEFTPSTSWDDRNLGRFAGKVSSAGTC